MLKKKTKKTTTHPKKPPNHMWLFSVLLRKLLECGNQQLHVYSICSFTAHDGGFFSSPQGDVHASQDKRSWFIIYESLYET